MFSSGRQASANMMMMNKLAPFSPWRVGRNYRTPPATICCNENPYQYYKYQSQFVSWLVTLSHINNCTEFDEFCYWAYYRENKTILMNLEVQNIDVLYS